MVLKIKTFSKFLTTYSLLFELQIKFSVIKKNPLKQKIEN